MTLHPDDCGPCADCRAALEDYRPLYQRTPKSNRGADAYLLHAQRFGPELVEETAKQHGVDLRVQAPKAKRMRRTTPNVRGQVLELASRGTVTEAIADVLNLSDRRVREILASEQQAA